MMKHFDAPFEIKSTKQEGDLFVFDGYASVFGTEDEGGDVVERGAFEETIRQNNGVVPLQSDHDPTLAKGNIGVAYVEEDRRGLKTRGEINTATTTGSDVASKIEFAQSSGLPVGMSFGFEVTEKTFRGDTRHIRSAQLYEISTTLFPMHQDAGVEEILQKDLTPSEERIFTTLAKELTRQLRYH